MNMSRNVIYQGDLDDLLAQHGGQFVMDGECAKLPQFFTDVGHTSRWLPGPRVVDLAYLLPGTVIANFVFENGEWKYPNRHGYHAGLFTRFEHRLLRNGAYSKFWMIDQWVGKQEGISERPMVGYSAEQAGSRILPCDNANEFCVVVVP